MTKFSKIFLCSALIISFAGAITACGKGGSNNEKYTIEAVTDKTYTPRDGQAEFSDTAIMYEVNVRQYTKEGTFAAFETHLERLKEMGVNTLWFMPIYSISELNKKGTLGSYYSIKDFKSVNNEFGTLEEFKALVDKAHSMGFNVILDWVANHTGWDHTWITEHPDYYLKDETGNIISPIGQDWTDVAQLDFANSSMKTAMIDAMSFWIKEVGVDGFRCDYAQGVPIEFWNEARTELNKIKPIYMVAEDGFNSTSLLNTAFDSSYNFELYDMLISTASGMGNASDLIYKIAPELPAGAFKMNFIENHDKNSWDGSLLKRFGEESIGAMTTLMFTIEGMPLIYSGQEESIDKTLEFFEKDNIDFGDYTYEKLISSLCKIKSTYKALNNVSGGDLIPIESNNKKVLSFKRIADGTQITVVMNLSKAEQKVKFDKKLPNGTIIFHGDGSGKLSTEPEEVKVKSSTTLSPWEYYIIVTTKDESN